jgi:hypothetical protein
MIRMTGDPIGAESDNHLRLNLCQDGNKLLDNGAFIGFIQFAVVPSQKTHISQTENPGGSSQFALTHLCCAFSGESRNTGFPLRRTDQRDLDTFRRVLRQCAALREALIIGVKPVPPPCVVPSWSIAFLLHTITFYDRLLFSGWAMPL